jgi:hypothetical protein
MSEFLPEDSAQLPPERFYVTDPEGKIAYRSEMGPWGFDAEAWRGAIEGLVSA